MQSEIPAEAARVLSGEAWAIIVTVGLFLNAAMSVVKLYFDRRDRGRIVEAAGCNYPTDMVPALREAMTRQVQQGAQQQSAHDELNRAITRLTDSLDRHTEKLIELVARGRT